MKEKSEKNNKFRGLTFIIVFLFLSFVFMFLAQGADIEVTTGVGVVLSNNTTEATVRQITPDAINVTLNSSNVISNYTLYIENTDPDLIKAYGNGITQSTYANNIIKLIFDLEASIPKTIDLHRIWYPTRWSFIALGDTRPGNDANSNLVSDEFEEIASEIPYVNPVYPILNAGDVIGGGSTMTSTPSCTEAMHQAYWNLQNNNGIWNAVVGNHDQARNGDIQGSAQQIFDKSWGSSNYSYPFGDWYFINANTYADDGTAPSVSNGNGFLIDGQWNWTESEIRTHNESYNEVVVFHHPLWRYLDGAGGSQGSWQDTNSNTNLRNLLTSSGVKLNIVGHEHFWHESMHGSMIQLVDGRGGAPLYGGETVWGFTIIELNTTDVAEITRVNITDGGDLTTSYNGPNNYTRTNLKATINNTHTQTPTIPCMLKFRMSNSNTTSYKVMGADYYDIIPNEYGYVVIVQATASSTKEVVVGTGIYNITLHFGWNLIGWTDMTTRTAHTVGNLIGSNCTYVVERNRTTGQYIPHNMGGPETENNFNLERGWGYYVYVSDETVWNRT